MKLKMVGFLALICGIVLLNQNCSQQKFTQRQTTAATQVDATLSSSRSGGNYDGKVYAHIDREHPCPDGQIEITKIRVQAQRFFLDREYCQPAGQEIPRDQIKIDTSLGDFLIYKSQTLVQTSASATKEPIELVCESRLTGDKFRSVVIVSGTSGLKIAKGESKIARILLYDADTTLLLDRQIPVSGTINSNNLMEYSGADAMVSLSIYSRWFNSDPNDPMGNAKVHIHTQKGLDHRDHTQCRQQ
ncbi:MAG: hypothetical protein AB7G93_03050 [Bdellovibrionales bacterium]